jgi:hypothetical protein
MSRDRPTAGTLNAMGAQRWAWLLPVAFLLASSAAPGLALESGFAFAGVWVVGGAVGYLWQAGRPRRLESRLLPWVGLILLGVLWMAATNGDPGELRESASQIVGLVGIVCGLVVRGASDLRRREDAQRISPRTARPG